MQSFRTLQEHETVESLASVWTHVDVRSLELIFSRIAERSAGSVEDDGGLIHNSNIPIQRLQEHALQVGPHHPPISAQVHDGEDATPEDGSTVRVGLS